MMEMSTWKRGYEQLPDMRQVEKELGESRKRTSVLWKYLAIGAIPILVCGVIALAVFAGVLSLGLVILHDRCPPAHIPVVRAYHIPFDMSPGAAYNWSNRSTTLTAFGSYLQSLASTNSLVYTNAYEPLKVKFNHNTKELYSLVYHEQYFDTPSKALEAVGASLRARTYISSTGNGDKLTGKTSLEYIFRSADVVLAVESAIDPSATQEEDGDQRLEHYFTNATGFSSPVSRFEHRVQVNNIAYQYVPTTISDLYILYDRVDHVLPKISGTDVLNVTVNQYVLEQIYWNDEIGPRDVLYPQKMETYIKFIYPTQAEAQGGTTQPTSGKVTFRMWMGNDGFGRWDHDVIDQGMTLFNTVLKSAWHTTPAKPSPSPSPAA